jgi:hypothetical protein
MIMALEMPVKVTTYIEGLLMGFIRNALTLINHDHIGGLADGAKAMGNDECDAPR